MGQNACDIFYALDLMIMTISPRRSTDTITKEVDNNNNDGEDEEDKVNNDKGLLTF